MTLTPAETCREIAEIIENEPHRFNPRCWQYDTFCGTVACIAGHTALLHGDGIDANPDLASEDTKSLIPDAGWYYRQAARLGLKPEASTMLFSPIYGLTNERYIRLLRFMAEKLEKSGRLIGVRKLHKIAAKAQG